MSGFYTAILQLCAAAGCFTKSMIMLAILRKAKLRTKLFQAKMLRDIVDRPRFICLGFLQLPNFWQVSSAHARTFLSADVANKNTRLARAA